MKTFFRSPQWSLLILALLTLAACSQKGVIPPLASKNTTADKSGSQPGPKPGPVTPDQPVTPLPTEVVQQALQKRVDAGLIHGAAVGLVNSNSSKSIFMGDAKSDSDLFEIGSISKSFTAIALMELVNEKKIDLGVPISAYLPELKDTFVGGVTARDLGLHQAQLIDSFDYGTWSNPKVFSEEALLIFLKNYKPDLAQFPPKERHYSNLGYATIGLLISRIEKKSYASVIAERIFTPLKMNSSGFILNSTAPSGLLQGYDVFGNTKNYTAYSDLASASGGIYSNLNDMISFLNANVNPDQSGLGQAILQSQQSGIGWDSLPKENPISKSGAMTAGFSSEIVFDVTKKLGTIVLFNQLNSPDASAIRRISMGTADHFSHVAFTDAQLSTWVGTYTGTLKVNGKNVKASILVQTFGARNLGIVVSAKSQEDVVGRIRQTSDQKFKLNSGLESDPIEFKDGQIVYYLFSGKYDSVRAPVYDTFTFKKK